MIHIIDNNLPPDLCKEMIRRFDNDDRVVEGYVGPQGNHRVDYSYKRCDELFITEREGWEDIDEQIYKHCDDAINEYLDLVTIQYKQGMSLNNDTGYKIKRYQPNSDYYNWHHDYDGRRLISMLWYLNDVDEGGETEFISGEKIQPKEGRVVIFPATWTEVHRGVSPISNVKYAMTTFFE